MNRPVLFLMMVAGLSLSACGGSGDGTSITLNAAGTDGNVVAGMDGKTGQMSIDVPGFVGKIDMPKIKLDAENFDLNGVHLYPGSTISGMNIDAKDAASSGKDRGLVRLNFESPAKPDVVRAWFLEKLTTAGDFTLQKDGTGLAGTSSDGKRFKLELAPSGDEKSNGVIVISG